MRRARRRPRPIRRSGFVCEWSWDSSEAIVEFVGVRERVREIDERRGACRVQIGRYGLVGLRGGGPRASSAARGIGLLLLLDEGDQRGFLVVIRLAVVQRAIYLVHFERQLRIAAVA